MTPKQQREELHKAYVAAVAARAGCKLGHWSQDSGCLDVSIGTHLNLGGKVAAPKLDLQLRSSSKATHDQGEFIAWSLARQHHDILRRPNHTPHLLVTLMLPPNEDEWLTQTPEQLIMRRCAHWVHLLGQPEIPTGRDSTTVHIPKSQVFSPDAILWLLERVGREEGRDAPLEGVP